MLTQFEEYTDTQSEPHNHVPSAREALCKNAFTSQHPSVGLVLSYHAESHKEYLKNSVGFHK